MSGHSIAPPSSPGAWAVYTHTRGAVGRPIYEHFRPSQVTPETKRPPPSPTSGGMGGQEPGPSFYGAWAGKPFLTRGRSGRGGLQRGIGMGGTIGTGGRRTTIEDSLTRLYFARLFLVTHESGLGE